MLVRHPRQIGGYPGIREIRARSAPYLRTLVVYRSGTMNRDHSQPGDAHRDRKNPAAAAAAACSSSFFF